jgi:hypothetical protein
MILRRFCLASADEARSSVEGLNVENMGYPIPPSIEVESFVWSAVQLE